MAASTASAFSFQTWNSGPFSMDRGPGKEPGTVVLRFHGPFTLRDVYSCLPTMTWNKMLEMAPEPGEQAPVKNILDLSDCTYVDSSGLGLIAKHFAHCQKIGVRMITCGMRPRVQEVFRITKMDTVIPHTATIDEAEAS